MAFHLNLNDLTFILKQIRIAERHVDSGYTQYVDDAGTPIGQLVPYGLRTVGGDYNNLVQPQSGAADLPMPRLLTPDFRSAPTTMIDFDGAGPAPSLPVTANPMVLDMNGPSVPGGQTQVSTNYAQIGGYVIDAQPRVISNLISDQSVNNPAAVVAALAAMGSADPWGQAQLLTAGRQALNDAVAARAQAQSAESAALQSLLALAPGQNLVDISQGMPWPRRSSGLQTPTPATSLRTSRTRRQSRPMPCCSQPSTGSLPKRNLNRHKLQGTTRWTPTSRSR